MIRFRKRLAPKRKLPAGIQAKLARTALRAAHTAADRGKCAVAEMLFGFGNVDLQSAVARARTKGPVFGTLGARMEGADAAKAFVECRERERTAPSPSGGKI